MGENNKEEVPKLVGNKSTVDFPMYKGCVTIQVRLALLKFKGVLHLLPPKTWKLACFVFCLKIINIFLKNDICILY